MSFGCPTELTVSGQVSLLRLSQEMKSAFGCPIASQKALQVQLLPQGRTQESKQPCEAMPPATDEGTKAQQHLNQQRRPDLPAHGIGIVSQKVGQLQGLFEFFKKHLNAPPAAIQIRHALCTPIQLVGQEHHLAQLSIDFHHGYYSTKDFWIIIVGIRVKELHQV